MSQFPQKITTLTFFLITCWQSILMGQVEVILTSAGPKSDVGLKADSIGIMYSFSLSPNGEWWAGEFELEDSLDVIHLRGSQLAPTNIMWTEGDPLPNGLAGSFRSSLKVRQTDVNDDGHVVGTARNIASAEAVELLYGFNDSGLSLIAFETSPIPAFPSASYGNSIDSPNALNDGSSSFLADNIVGPGISTMDDAIGLVANGTSLTGPRKGVTEYNGQLLQRFNPEQFFTSPDGSTFLFSGDTVGDTATDDIVVLGAVGTSGNVVLQEGVTPIQTSNGTATFDNADEVFLAGNNDWYARGDLNAPNSDVILKNGQVLAAEGESAPNGFNYVNHLAMTADSEGNYAWVWRTSNPDLDQDSILVYNGEHVLLSEGDVIMFDYTGDGVDDPAVIENLTLDANSLRMGGGYIYLMVEVDEPDTTFIGHAFIRVPVPTILTPTSFFVDAGQKNSGEIFDLFQSDNNHVLINRPTTQINSTFLIRFQGESPVANPSQLDFTYESSALSRRNVEQTIQYFNFNTSSYEDIDTRNASRSGDLAVTVTPTGDLSRFVEPGSNRVEVRVRYRTDVPRQSYGVRIDQAIWTLTR